MGMNKFLKYLRKFSFGFLTLLYVYISIPYLISPIYNFPQAKPFTGDSIVNPYAEINNNNWHKGVFQYHSNSWGILTDGRYKVNTTDSIKALFRHLGYSIIGISDYMRINPCSHVPLYEHGMGVHKTHRLVMGSNSVLWLDFILPHTTHHKQFLINLLKKPHNMVALSHPSWNNSYTVNDVKRLRNYDCFEILNINKESLALWDTTLSNGYPAFLLADDDGHNVSNLNVTGRVFTLVSTPSLEKEDIINSIKSGKTIGVDIKYSKHDNLYDRKKSHERLIIPDVISFINDTIIITMPQAVERIFFIGQNGEIKAEFADCFTAKYHFKPEDNYIRPHIVLAKRDALLYLNPFYRTNANQSFNSTEINFLYSILYWLLIWPIFIYALYRIVLKLK